MLWITSDRVPDGLDLTRPTGRRIPAPAASSALHATPTYIRGDDRKTAFRPRLPPGPRRPGPGGTRAYSTVTDFARFRGWSTSLPRAVASSQAKTCSGTVATSGWSRVGVAGMLIRWSA